MDYHLAELDQTDKVIDVLDQMDEKIEAQKVRRARADGDYDFEVYHSYDEVKAYSQSLTGDDVEYKVYGSSVEGRELFSVEIGSGDSVSFAVFLSLTLSG